MESQTNNVSSSGETLSVGQPDLVEEPNETVSESRSRKILKVRFLRV